MKTLEHRQAHHFFTPDQNTGAEQNPAICSGGLLPGVQKIVNLKGPPGLLEEQLKLPIACPSTKAKTKPSLPVDIKDPAVPIRIIRLNKTDNKLDHSLSVLKVPVLISVVASQAAQIHPLKTRCQHKRRHLSLQQSKNQITPQIKPTADFVKKKIRESPLGISLAKYSNKTSTCLRLHTDEILSKLALITSSPQVRIEHNASQTPLQNKLPSHQQIGTGRQSSWPK